MTSGDFKPIEQVQPQDRVLSRDQHGQTIAYQPVEETYRRTSYYLRHLTFESVNGDAHHTQTLQTTDEHPFWNATTGTFTHAGKLKVGDRVTGPDGQLQVLAKTERTEHPEGVPVFNFRVADYHTYYAAAPGGTPVLVHNADYPLDQADHVRVRDLPWGNTGAKRAAILIEDGELTVMVGSRDDASELVWHMYGSRGYRNTTGRVGVDVRERGGKRNTCHWDETTDAGGRIVGHGDDNAHGALPHVQVHTEDQIIRTFFPR